MRRRIARWLLDSLPLSERAFLVETLLAEPVSTETRHGTLHFLNHGRGSYKRARTLPTKEPGTLRWIDAMAPGSVLWDVGANVGALSLYAARRGDLQVWAFEPAAVNFYNLTANRELNGLDDSLHCLLMALGDEDRIGSLRASQLAPARSFSFRRGKPDLRKAAVTPGRQDALVRTADTLIAEFRVPPPDYMKIDVPGMTLDILRGAEGTLASPALKQLQIEVKESGAGGRKVVELLARHGFAVAGRPRKNDGELQGDVMFERAA